MKKQQNGAVRNSFKTSERKNPRKGRNTTDARREARAKVDRTVNVIRADSEALRVASHLAGGDLTRLAIQPDGSVVVRNRGRK
jgi:hypothetical protein